MVFRADPTAPLLVAPPDPLARFTELFAALDAPSGIFTDRTPLRLAAINLITVPGEAAAIADAFYAHERELRARLGWLSGAGGPIRRVLASHFVKVEDEPAAFVAEVERVQALFRAIRLRRGGVYETLAVLVLRRVLGGAAIDEVHVARFAAIYAALKRHHWWLTGPEEFPACAMLCGRPGAPEAIGAGIEAIYCALHQRARLWGGDALQTAASLLHLSGADPQELAERFALLAERFRGAGATIGQAEYDDLALLCFLAVPVERIVATVIAYRDALHRGEWFQGRAFFSLAANLAFVQLAGTDGALGPLADAKLLLDMQALVNAGHSG